MAKRWLIGASFDGTFAQSAPDQTPKKEPPAVVSNPGASVPLVRSVRRKVPFRLEYPLLLEKTSSPSTLEPVRAYTIAKGHKAVRIVYSTNTAGDYWGIEETDWTDAPVCTATAPARPPGKPASTVRARPIFRT